MGTELYRFAKLDMHRFWIRIAHQIEAAFGSGIHGAEESDEQPESSDNPKNQATKKGHCSLSKSEFERREQVDEIWPKKKTTEEEGKGGQEHILSTIFYYSENEVRSRSYHTICF